MADMVASSKVSWATSWRRTVPDNTSSLQRHHDRMVLFERHGGIWNWGAAAKKVIRYVGVNGFVEMRRPASKVKWSKTAPINASEYLPVQFFIGGRCKWPWSMQDEKHRGDTYIYIYLNTGCFVRIGALGFRKGNSR